MMRLKEKEQDKAFALAVFRDCQYATLSTVNPDGTPYGVIVSTVVVDGAVCFHGANEGKKVDNIKANPNVSISGVKHTKLLPERFTTEYESAIASGKCVTVEDKGEKIKIIRAICEKYAPSSMGEFDAMVARLLDVTKIFKIQIATITGKANY